MSLTVLLQNSDSDTPLTEDFQRWVSHALVNIPNKIPPEISELTIRIVDDTESAQLNGEFRKKEGPTNILSFSYNPMPGFQNDSLGDLAICKNVVIDEAKKAEIPVLSHWAHLTVHGVLHLLGYDHEKDDEAEIMEALEIQILEKLGFDNPYADHEQGKIHDRG